ncbi:hypothetical protein F5Y05DRAFT_418401 [Hypoxylon sp. FL0543]|nr:hypothetical protein F5Y05DRAFT_418401 [Hypoxylon sp. FL0543]
MESASVGKCAQCGTETSGRCTKCLDAPEYQPGDSPDLFYCNSDCQQQHWQFHKAECTIRMKRKKLLRTAMLMKATYLAFRECVYRPLLGGSLTGIELCDGVLTLHIDPDPKRSNPWLSPFPENLVASKELKEAALACGQGEAAIYLLVYLARHLLKDAVWNLEVPSALVKPLVPWRHNYVKPAMFTPFTIHFNGHKVPHDILVVQLSEDEKWVVDVTGCQFGFPEVMSPSGKYYKDRTTKIFGPYPEDEAEHLDLRCPTFTYDEEEYRAVRTAQSEYETTARRRLVALFQERFFDGSQDYARGFLDGTQEEFRARLDGFVADVKAHMMRFVGSVQGKTYPEI